MATDPDKCDCGGDGGQSRKKSLNAVDDRVGSGNVEDS